MKTFLETQQVSMSHFEGQLIDSDGFIIARTEPVRSKALALEMARNLRLNQIIAETDGLILAGGFVGEAI